jgi:hypothetical protein
MPLGMYPCRYIHLYVIDTYWHAFKVNTDDRYEGLTGDFFNTQSACKAEGVLGSIQTYDIGTSHISHMYIHICTFIVTTFILNTFL